MDVETSNVKRKKINAWLSAMRLRTLPLALASTFTGAFAAMTVVSIDGWVLLWTALTTVFLQINSNLANDYGDFSHGTDNDERIGPERALQSGAITLASMRRGIAVFSALSFFSGIVLLYVAPLQLFLKGPLLLAGIAAIYASVRYTAGQNPYGYRGLGDLAVLVFFGFLGVVGSFVCQVGQLDWAVLLPALAVGCFSAGVLNVNNTRDIDSDRNAGKITLAVRLGAARARWYQVALIITGCAAMVLFGYLRFDHPVHWLFLISFPLFFWNAWKVLSTKDARSLDPMLKQLALSTFLFSLLIGLGQWLGT